MRPLQPRGTRVLGGLATCSFTVVLVAGIPPLPCPPPTGKEQAIPKKMAAAVTLVLKVIRPPNFDRPAGLIQMSHPRDHTPACLPAPERGAGHQEVRAAAYLGARLSRHASGSVAPGSTLEQRRHTVGTQQQVYH